MCKSILSKERCLSLPCSLHHDRSASLAGSSLEVKDQVLSHWYPHTPHPVGLAFFPVQVAIMASGKSLRLAH